LEHPSRERTRLFQDRSLSLAAAACRRQPGPGTNRASASIASAKQCVNLFRSETALHEKAHLAAAFPEILGACRTEPFQPHRLEQSLPVRGIELQTGLDQGLVYAALAQLRPDLLRPLAALEAGMDE